MLSMRCPYGEPDSALPSCCVQTGWSRGGLQCGGETAERGRAPGSRLRSQEGTAGSSALPTVPHRRGLIPLLPKGPDLRLPSDEYDALEVTAHDSDGKTGDREATLAAPFPRDTLCTRSRGKGPAFRRSPCRSAPGAPRTRTRRGEAPTPLPSPPAECPPVAAETKCHHAGG